MQPDTPSPPCTATEAEFHLNDEAFDYYVVLPGDTSTRGFLAMERAAAELGFDVVDPDEDLPHYREDGTVLIYLVPRDGDSQ